MKTRSGAKIPSPDHPITISPARQRIRIFSGDRQIADSDNTLVLQEASYPAVYYVPRSDADMATLSRSEKTTYCPYKGEASYFSVRSAEGDLEDAVWSYETPFAAVGQIAGHLAFYPDKVRIEVG